MIEFHGPDDPGLESLIGDHLARNEVLVVKLRDEYGVDLDSPRVIDLHFWSRDGDSAHGLASALEADGFVVSAFGPRMIGPGEQHPSHFNVEASKTLCPAAVVADYFVRGIATLASQHGSVFDGWGTSV